MVVSISMVLKRKKMFLIKAVYFCCALALDIYFKYAVDNYLLQNVLPEKEFNHLRRVNKQPY